MFTAAPFYVCFLTDILRHEQHLHLSPNILLCASIAYIRTIYLTRQGPPQPRFGVGRRWMPADILLNGSFLALAISPGKYIETIL